MCENCRPISLLNTLYKILAAAIQIRIEQGIEQELQKTQYGFRKLRGTQEAFYNIRRVITAGESSQTKTFLLPLDWAKDFDKKSHEGFISALDRMGGRPKTNQSNNQNIRKSYILCRNRWGEITNI